MSAALLALLAVATVFPRPSIDPAILARIKFVEIDGAKAPELIPEWVVWEAKFRMVSRRHAIEDFDNSLGRIAGFTAADRGALNDSADLSANAQNDCKIRQLVRAVELRAQQRSVAETNAANQELALECRTRSLAIADALMTKLSPDGRAGILVWWKKGRESTSILIAEHEIAFNRLPR